MATLAELLPQLRRLYDEPRRCRFITLAHRVLAQAPAAPELTQLTLRALAEAELGGPARELVQLRRDLPVADDDRAELRRSLAALPDGRIRWEDRAADFDRNFAALAETRPQWRGRADELRSTLRRAQLHRTRGGDDLLSVRAAGKLRDWLGPVSGGEDEADLTIPPREQLGPALVVGLRDGALLETLYDRTADALLWYGHPLYLLEPEPVRFAAWLHCGDHARLLADPRVHVFVGADAVDQLAACWRGNRRLQLPTFLAAFVETPAVVEAVRLAMEQEHDRRVADVDRIEAELAARYRDRDAAYWAKRLTRPGRVLGVTSRFTTMLQYSMRDALAAFEASGYETHLVIEESDYELLTRGEVGRRIIEVDPDILLYIDHLRYEYPHLPQNLPMITWVQDPLPNLLCPQAGASIGPFDMALGMYRRKCIDEFGYPPDRFVSQTTPVSTRVFHDAPLDADDMAQYGCDVCYVGHGVPSLEFYRDERAAEFPAAWKPLLDAIYERVLAALSDDGFVDWHSDAGALLSELAAAHGVELSPAKFERIKTFYLYRLFDIGRREQSLCWAAAWASATGRRLRIYGNCWDAHPELGRYACGPIEHGEPLRRAYRGATLALQVIPSGFLHQRSHELLLSGATPITRYCPDDFAKLPVEEFCRRRDAGEPVAGAAAEFPGLERIVFHSAADFADVAERLLASADEREELRTRFCAAVRAEYVYDAAVAKVLPALRASIEQQAAATETHA